MLALQEVSIPWRCGELFALLLNASNPKMLFTQSMWIESHGTHSCGFIPARHHRVRRRAGFLVALNDAAKMKIYRWLPHPHTQVGRGNV